MEKPKFKVPKTFEKRTGRIALFLVSVAAVSYLFVRVGRDYAAMYTRESIALPFHTKLAIVASQFISSHWWAVAIAAILVTLLFYAITKSGTVFTILSILAWLAGAAAYVSLWLPSRLLE